MYADELLRPWFDCLLESVPGTRLFDVHTHSGASDPDGFHATGRDIEEALAAVDARGALFTLAEPGGYSGPNRRVLEEAAASDGRMVPFCRLDPSDDPVVEAERCLSAGAVGFKLHPRAEGFTLDAPGVSDVFALAHERRLPVIVHAGRGIPALGRHALELSERFPDARPILAHAGICDLAWIWREAEGRPNLFFDTAWWNPADLRTLFSLVAPGQILLGSDAPYGTPLQGAILALRFGLQVGLSEEQLHGVCGGQVERLLAGEEPLDLGRAPGTELVVDDVLLARVFSFLVVAISAVFEGGNGEEGLALARLACEVGEDAPQAPVCRSVLALLDRLDHYRARRADDPRDFRGLHLVVTAATVAMTPRAPLPRDPERVAVGERAE